MTQSSKQLPSVDSHAAHQTGSQPYDTADELISTWYREIATSDGMCAVDLPVPVFGTKVHASSLAGRKTEMRGHVAESTYVMIESTLWFDDVEDIPGLVLLLRVVQRTCMWSRKWIGRRPGNDILIELPSRTTA